MRTCYKSAGLIALFILSFVNIAAQEKLGLLKGIVTDANTGLPVYNAAIGLGRSLKTRTNVDGSFSISTYADEYIMWITASGYDTLRMRKIILRGGDVKRFNIPLVSIQNIVSPKIDTPTTKIQGISPAKKQKNNNILYPGGSELIQTQTGPFENAITGIPLQATIDNDLGSSLSRLPFVQMYPQGSDKGKQIFTLNGMGGRYTQLLWNGMPFQDINGSRDGSILTSMPSEMIDKVAASYTGAASIPGDMAGGTISIATKLAPDYDFIYLSGGAGFNNTFDQQVNKTEKGMPLKWMGLASNQLDLPSEFPNTRGRVSLQELNTQEQVRQLQRLNNSLPFENNTTNFPQLHFTAGAGKKWKLKNERTFAVIFMINQQKTEMVEETEVQIRPDIRNNPFPFSNQSVLIKTASSDSIHSYLARLNGMLNFTLVGKNSKYSFQNSFNRTFQSQYIEKTNVIKPDEDNLARSAIFANTTLNTQLISQLSGEHELSEKTRLRLVWKASYSFSLAEQPDSRSFLLVNDPSDEDRFGLAAPSQGPAQNSFVRSGNSRRMWSENKSNNFSGTIELQAPFQYKGKAHLLTGGIWLNSQYHEYFSDIFLYSQNNDSYQILDSLLAPAQYFPSGTNVINYNQKLEAAALPFANDFSKPENLNNYLASASTAAAYIQLHNSFGKRLSLQWGLRAETSSQLISNTQYQYSENLSTGQLYTISLNSRINSLDLLPSVKFNYDFTKGLGFEGGYARTVTRPALSEMTRNISYDPASFSFTQGSQLLENTLQDHVYAGLKAKSTNNSFINASAFYRYLDRPVEYRLTAAGSALQIRTPYNMPSAVVKGIRTSLQLSLYELLQTSFASNLYLYGSGIYQQTTVKAGPVKNSDDVGEHDLTETPEYMFTAGLTLADPRFPNISIFYQNTADHLFMVGSGAKTQLANGAVITEIPDTRMGERSQFNIRVSQKLFNSSLLFIAGINNVVENNNNTIYQDLNGNSKFDDALQLRIQSDGGFRNSGTDNIFWNAGTKRTYYFTLSYLFK